MSAMLDHPRMPEWSIDVLLWQELDVDPRFAEFLLGAAGPTLGVTATEAAAWHSRGNGETDVLLVVATSDDESVELHIENKVDAQWSDPTQPQRYREYVEPRPHVYSLVVAPQRWLDGHDDGTELFDGRVSYEQIADWLEEHARGDARRRWVVERIRSATRPPVRGENVVASDVEAWVASLARIAAEFGLHPKTTGFLRRKGTPGKKGRFIPDLEPLPGPGRPALYYKIGKPGVRATRVDLAWSRPDAELAEQIAEAAFAARFEAVWSGGESEFYVRVDGGDDFGDLLATRPVEEQVDQARAMFEAASGLREWWDEGRVLGGQN